ncbi:hypothetical protein PV773_22835 [Mesorhizobium sp. CC13]|uniref:hypothetical protein n=1 Tax=Mesorhizobium sp. CC13 TaxID=3029194 RepID=UPI0032641AEF
MRYCWQAVGLVALAGMTQASMAATQGVIFNGNVTATCTLVINSNGTMTVSAGLQSMSSQNAGGSPGSVALATTGGVTLSVDAVASPTVPAGDTTPTTWTPTYSSAGAHAISETGSSTPLTVPGLSTVSVNLTGTKSGANSFTSGAYQATVVLRCE